MDVETLTSPAFAEAARRPDAVALLPWGIVEEHGPHLPLGTDTWQALAVCRAAAERTGAMLLPAVAYGNCVSTRNFPGSISIQFDTVRALALDVMQEVARNGVKRLAVVSGHAGGGHMRAVKLAAEEAVERDPSFRVAVTTPWDDARAFAKANPADVRGVPEWDGHAGALETSSLLHLHPERVHGRGAAHKAAFPDPIVVADPERYFPTGVLGDPTKASADLGRALNAFFVERLCDVVGELRKA